MTNWISVSSYLVGANLACQRGRWSNLICVCLIAVLTQLAVTSSLLNPPIKSPSNQSQDVSTFGVLTQLQCTRSQLNENVIDSSISFRWIYPIIWIRLMIIMTIRLNNGSYDKQPWDNSTLITAIQIDSDDKDGGNWFYFQPSRIIIGEQW